MDLEEVRGSAAQDSVGHERLAFLFQPDILLPGQYFGTLRRKYRLEPEKRLMLAILEDAVSCFQKYVFAEDRREQKRFRETEDWILEQNSDWFFSFENICEVLGFDPQYIRLGLMRWKEKATLKPKEDARVVLR